MEMFKKYWIIVTYILATVYGQCPNVIPQCTCTFENNYITQFRCRGLGSLPNVPDFYNPSSEIIQTLRIGDGEDIVDDTRIKSIQERAFDGLRLRTLSLTDLGITTVDSEAFYGLGAYLESLYIDENRITSLPADVFQGLSSLIYLHLDGNGLLAININFLQPLTSLQHLHLQNNQLHALPLDVFTDLRQLERLYLDNNRLTALPNGLMTSLENIRIINLNGNDIAEIGNETFTQLTLLERVELQHNNITSLSPNLFQNNRRLLHVDISFNHITSVPIGLIKSVDMVYLDFGFNEITEIHSSTFRLLRSLEYLYMRDNQITSIVGSTFENLNSLLVLDLQSNRIGTIEYGFFEGLRALKELYLQYNEIDTVGFGVFDQLANVQAIDLAGNRIAHFETSPFLSCKKLESIRLSGNLLKSVTTDMFVTQTQLEYLYLNMNNIRLIALGSFDALSKLRYLDLSENWLTHIEPSTFATLYNLKTLRLARNPLLALDGVFNGLISLTELHLNNSCFQDIPAGFASNLDNLERLYIRNNDLGLLHSNTFTSMPRLSVIDLRYCNIEVLQSNAFGSSVQELHLSHNQLVCNCSHVWLRSIVRKIVHPEYLVCSEPSNLANYYTVCYTHGSCDNYQLDQTGSSFCSSSSQGSITGLPSDDDGLYVDTTVCDLGKYPGLVEGSTPAPTAPSDIISDLDIWVEGEMLVFMWQVEARYSGRIESYNLSLTPEDVGARSYNYPTQVNSTMIALSQLTSSRYSVCISVSFDNGPRYNDLLCEVLHPGDYTTTPYITSATSDDVTTESSDILAVNDKDKEDGFPILIIIIIAVVGGVLVLIIFVLIVCCLCSRKSAAKKEKDSDRPSYPPLDVDGFNFGGNQEELVEQSVIYSTFERNTIERPPSKQNGTSKHI